MDRRFAKVLLGWGVALWLIGYILGIVLIAVVPTSLVGWVILPIGVAITCWVLVNQVRSEGLARYTLLGVVWTLIAIVFDYVFIVAAFHPADGSHVRSAGADRVVENDTCGCPAPRLTAVMNADSARPCVFS